jgi:hypothetical protein
MKKHSKFVRHVWRRDRLEYIITTGKIVKGIEGDKEKKNVWCLAQENSGCIQ